MHVVRGYKTELDLNDQERTACLKHAGAARFAYNWGLARSMEAYRTTGKRPTGVDLHKQLNALKPTDFPWMYELRYQNAKQEKDISHLHKLTTSLGSNHPVITRENKLKGSVYRYGQVHIDSKRLATALKHLGVGERKSFTVRPCEHVTEALLHHYWRGVFDGDGFITLTRSRKVGSIIWLTGVVGNKEMVTGFESFIQRSVKAEAIIKPHHRIFMIRYGGVALPQTILRVLYQDATIFLTRKHECMNEVMNTAIQRVKS